MEEAVAIGKSHPILDIVTALKTKNSIDMCLLTHILV